MTRVLHLICKAHTHTTIWSKLYILPMYVQMFNIYQKYRKYRKNMIFSIFTIFSNRADTTNTAMTTFMNWVNCVTWCNNSDCRCSLSADVTLKNSTTQQHMAYKIPTNTVKQILECYKPTTESLQSVNMTTPTTPPTPPHHNHHHYHHHLLKVQSLEMVRLWLTLYNYK